jgi:hypothetical protein
MIETEHRPQRRLLGRIACQIDVGEHPPTACEQRRVMAIDKAGERGTVTRTRRSHQPPITPTVHL